MKMQNPKILIDCSILTLTLFIAMPMIANAVGSMNFLSVILLIGFPLLCLICGILCGRENGLQLHYPALTAVLFVPSMLFFFDLSVWPLWLVYALTAFIGVAVGYFIQRCNSTRQKNGRLK